MVDTDKLVIRQNTDENRFEADLGDGKIAVVEYMLAGKNILYTHTEVPVGYEGRGIASKMARHALDYAREQGYKVQAVCPYIAMYVARHPEYQSNTWGY